MAIRNYGSHSDEELRRALGAKPDDIDAVGEAAKRFAAQDSTPSQDQYDEAIEEAHQEGYEQGFDEGKESVAE